MKAEQVSSELFSPEGTRLASRTGAQVSVTQRRSQELTITLRKGCAHGHVLNEAILFSTDGQIIIFILLKDYLEDPDNFPNLSIITVSSSEEEGISEKCQTLRRNGRGKNKIKMEEEKGYFAPAFILNLNAKEQTDNLGKTYNCSQR